MGVREENIAQQSDELYALEAIYGEENCLVNHEGRCCEVFLPSAKCPALRLRLHLPDTYPSTSAPLAELWAAHLSADTIEWALKHLELEQFSPGQLILYDYIEWLKEQKELQLLKELPGDNRPDLSEQLASDLHLTDAQEEDLEDERRQQKSLWQQAKVIAGQRADIEKKLVHAEPFTERKSTFQAHLAAVMSVQDVEGVMSVLLQISKVQRATHNIMAYRIFVAEKDTFIQDFDDDGETAAGSRLLHLLQILDARDVIVVVSRWFGGTLLGPARFTHINNAARMLLDECGYISRDAGGKKKKAR